MHLLIINNSNTVEHLWGKPLPLSGVTIRQEKIFEPAMAKEADVIIDFDFESEPQRIDIYKTTLQPVLIASTLYSLEELQVTTEPIARFNNWPCKEERNLVEVAMPQNQIKIFEQIFSTLSIPFQNTKDIVGFVTARIISLIINEAFLALQEQVSTKDEIDIAMKLGTNYPMGPFEWCNAIGNKNVHELLAKLSLTEKRYTPASVLKQSIYE